MNTEKPSDGMTGQTRDAHGKWERDLATAERDAKAAKLRSEWWSYSQIAEHLGIPKSTAYESVQRVLAETVQEPADDVRKMELERLDQMAVAVKGVLERNHVVVSQGRIVQRWIGWEQEEDGRYKHDREGARIPIYEDLDDDAPVLQAVDRLLKIQERRARLLGLDAPQRVSVDAENLGREIAELFAAGTVD